MKDKNKWKYISGLFLVLIIFALGYYFKDSFTNSGNEVDDKPNISQTTNPLPIPALLEDMSLEDGKAEFNLIAQHGKTEFVKGKEVDTMGYNGSYLGPVIRVRKGDDVTINVNNELKEETTVHWHGLEVNGDMDGGPNQVIDSNTTWSPSFVIDQPASTLWFHPHVLHKTGEQVYKGLAGLFYIEDEFSDSLNIPKDYGVNDIPIVVQDKRFNDRGEINYNLDMMDSMHGFMGDTAVINGAINPQLEVKNEVIRLRLLNGSNARAYDFNFSDNAEFYQIASDGGFLSESVPMTQVSVAPGERAEILLDLSEYKLGDMLTFKDSNANLMTIKITEKIKSNQKIPKDLVEIEEYDLNDVVRSINFVMSGMGSNVSINGKQMDMNRIDETLNLNELEEWVITNEGHGNGMGMGGMMGSGPHPFHVHSVQFRIIERNGKKPAANEQGWKDTVMLDSGEEVKILVKFKKPGLFMYHCHILEHEDAGMMGLFSVE